MNDSMTTAPWLPDFFQPWLQYAFLLEVLQNLLMILLVVVVFSLLYALLDLFLLCRQEYQLFQRSRTNKPAINQSHHLGFKATLHKPSRK